MCGCCEPLQSANRRWSEFHEALGLVSDRDDLRSGPGLGVAGAGRSRRGATPRVAEQARRRADLLPAWSRARIGRVQSRDAPLAAASDRADVDVFAFSAARAGADRVARLALVRRSPRGSVLLVRVA